MKKLITALKEKLGDEVITEELMTDLQAQFDVLVNEKVQEIVTIKETELEETSATEMTEFKDSLVESLDKYIEYASDEYLKENEIAIEAGSKVLAAEKIIESARLVFKEVGMEIPESELDHVKEMEADITESTDKLNTAIDEVIESKKQIFEFEKAIKFQKMTSKLTESKIEELHDLLEGLEYKNVKDFERKVNIVMEKVVDKKTITEKNEQDLDNLDDFEETNSSSIDKYLI